MSLVLATASFALTAQQTPVIASLFGVPLLCGSLEKPALSPCDASPSSFDGI